MGALQEAITALQKQGVLRRALSPAQVQALERSIQRNALELSRSKIRELLDAFKTRIEDVLNPRQVGREGLTETVTQGLTQGTARSQLLAIVQEMGADEIAPRIEFMLDVSTKVASGAGKFIQQNADPELVDLYPALELERFYDRDVPRGFRTVKGELVEVPDDDWPTRWQHAAAESGDTDAARVLTETGRMVARKDSPIWQALGNGAGGYDDTLGNPFPPFAFNSGFNTRAISRAEAVDLGLIQPGAKVSGADIDYEKLLALKEAA